MSEIHINKGHDIKMFGSPERDIIDKSDVPYILLDPRDYRGVKPKMIVKEGDSVKKGSPIFYNKLFPDMIFTSPVCGRVVSIVYGARRVVESVKIEIEGSEQEIFDVPSMDSLNSENISEILLKSGLWASIRQRPFSKIPIPGKNSPKSIFVSAKNTAPYSMDVEYALSDRKEDIENGFSIIKKCFDCDINLVVDYSSNMSLFENLSHVNIHKFSGPHPSGNTGIHIHHIDPIGSKDDVVYYLSLQSVADIGLFFNKKSISSTKMISVGGEGLIKPAYYKIAKGSPISQILSEENLDESSRIVSGDILSGLDREIDQGLDSYHEILSVIKEDDEREFLGWILPGFNKYTLSNTFLSRLLPRKESSFNSKINGSHRAIIPFGRWEEMLPMDIIPDFLVKSIIAKDIEDMEKYGIYECDPEDFALCTYACQSKVEVSSIIQEGLDIMEVEG